MDGEPIENHAAEEDAAVLERTAAIEEFIVYLRDEGPTEDDVAQCIEALAVLATLPVRVVKGFNELILIYKRDACGREFVIDLLRQSVPIHKRRIEHGNS